MKKADLRKFMEQAVKVMSQSIAEPRTDGKASPKVGAVLRKPDGTVETAFRGELRQGDHAEFTLLERKNRDTKLDGSILFATLEPCAPNARGHPKLGCAERIVLARIQEVWVGIEIPDPTVDRKGIKYLQDAGVKVHMFDRDLQEVIRAENKEFIAQALERAAAASEEKTRDVTLSPLESVPGQSQIDDLSSEALEAYRAIVSSRDDVSSPSFKRRLARQGLLQQQGDRFTPTGFGLLLFGEEPRTAMPQAGLLATIHYPDGTEEIRNFEGPQVLVPEQALQWLRDKLPNLIDRSQAHRRETTDALFEIVREGIVNALVHRDYSITGAKCQLVVTQDTIEIRSPGRPVEPITLEQMRSFSAPMLSRNPVLHFVFARMEMAEERGLGLRSMKRRAVEAGLPLPRYAWEDPYLVLTLYRTPTAATTALPADVQGALTAAERAGWQWLTTHGLAKSPEYAKAMKIDSRTARRHLNRFVELGLVRKTGSARSTVYEVV
ncbi:MAG TPA: ATP-binding protein [Gemmataceae bacterium]|jgi:ATP-dependent DNA helicase RecG|nr:ATP-binding protein [Gemmataceae bacterium]